MKKEETTTQNTKWFKTIGVFFAIGIFIGYAIFLFFLVRKVESIDKELYWTRFMSLFASVQAIVLSAAGFIFGKEVNNIKARSATEVAKKEKDKKETAEAEAKKALLEADKGKRIASAVLNSNYQTPRTGLESTPRAARSPLDSDELSFLTNLVKELYPDLKSNNN